MRHLELCTVEKYFFKHGLFYLFDVVIVAICFSLFSILFLMFIIQDLSERSTQLKSLRKTEGLLRVWGHPFLGL